MLDQLQGGAIPLSAVRSLFGDVNQFVRAAEAMLGSGEIHLLEAAST